ncbi:MAG: type I glutamate--ammonia ligase [Paludibacter sp.]|nr:type I glutamate--ammonia ligase [Paludibacter sp.]
MESYEEIIDFIRTNCCDFIDLKFVDLLGTWHHINVTATKFCREMFESGVGFDGSSIRGFQNIANSDMILLPDITTAFIDPIYAKPTVSLICDVKDPVNKRSFSRDPRHVARKAENYLKSSGIADVSYWGPELEFFIFDNVRFKSNNCESYFHINAHEGLWNSGDNVHDNFGYYIRQKSGYFAIPPNDQTLDVRSKIAKTMIQAGLEVEFHHHEVATAGQTEIGMRYGTLLRQADRVLLGKYITKNIAKDNGHTATFMPKPLYMDNGNAMHVHNSLWKDDENIFYDPDGYSGLSNLALNYVGGILIHSPALLAFCAPSTNSYRRLVPGFEAPIYLVYSKRNRSAAIRIPSYSADSSAKRIEFRCPDSTSNPYLAFAAILMAGLDGINNKIDPGKPFDRDISELNVKNKKSMKPVPASLSEALESLENDHEFLLKGGVFTSDLITTWIAYKRKNEVNPVSFRPHPYEFQLYYDI